MRVTVKIVGARSDYRPGFDDDGVAVAEMSAGATVQDLIERFDLAALGRIAVIADGAPVADGDRDTTALRDGGEVVILPPIEGG